MAASPRQTQSLSTQGGFRSGILGSWGQFCSPVEDDAGRLHPVVQVAGDAVWLRRLLIWQLGMVGVGMLAGPQILQPDHILKSKKPKPP